jgi:glucose-6-phosphate isomerase
MTIRQTIDGCLDHAIGATGLSQAELNSWLDKLAPSLARLQAAAASRSMPHIRILYEQDDIKAARDAYARLIDGARVVVVFGTGGSSLGGQALAQLGGWYIPGDDRTGRPRLRFYDNLDAQSLAQGLDILDLATTRFIVISKSGGTAETLSQMLTVLQRIKAAGLEQNVAKMFLGVTEPDMPGVSNGLRNLCNHYGIATLPHPTDIGGRYSVFTVVGLLPALARGLDIEAFRAGGRLVVEALVAAKTPAEFAPAVGAALQVGFAKDRNTSVSVMMPYSDRLARFSHWYAQLWAESLGKNDSEGTTPVAALGPVDQHSQLQLFLGGAQHHLATIVRSAVLPSIDTPHIDSGLAALAGASYLAGHTIGELVMAQTRAISDAFTTNMRPARVMEYTQLNEHTLGALMMHFVLETVLAADLMGVDPFDQPAVESGKVLTKKYLAAMAAAEASCCKSTSGGNAGCCGE